MRRLYRLGGFNPCFCGTRSRTVNSGSVKTIFSVFQSLFLWNSLSDYINYSVEIVTMMFQSLFLWNSLSDTAVVDSIMCPSPGFNPCFCGTRSRTTRATGGRVDHRGFNPCFCGTRSRTLIAATLDGYTADVSILVFVELALGLTLPPYYALALIVSILVFVELALGLDGSNASDQCPAWFQSLFLWNSLSDSGYESESEFAQKVSILVFVELALGPPVMLVRLSSISSFNPCFCGTRSRT